MNWDYAEMSKMAKQLGGPEQYADHLYNSGRMSGLYEGRGQGILAGIAGTLGGMAITYLVSSAFEKYRTKRQTESVDTAEYKEKLIRTMEARATAELERELLDCYGDENE